jgi:hypothetical protein
VNTTVRRGSETSTVKARRSIRLIPMRISNNLLKQMRPTASTWVVARIIAALICASLEYRGGVNLSHIAIYKAQS